MKRGIATYCLIFIGVLTTLLPNTGSAQDSDDLYIFGFSQTIFNYKNVHSFTKSGDITGVPVDFTANFESNTFALHQLDLFFRKPINEKTVFFLNLSATGSYSSALNFGNLQIPEGWVSYQITPNIIGKVGLMAPTFNNLNEIKNRLPLLPYLIRPLIYEALFYGIFSEQDYLPQSAYLQVSGTKLLTRNTIFDFAFNMGNSEYSYASQIEPGTGPISVGQESATIYNGENLTTLLSFGGRVGLRSVIDTYKLGVSFTRDYDNRNEITNYSVGRFPNVNLPVFGDVPRYRIGVDLSWNWDKLSFESEYIRVLHDHSEIHETPQYQNVNMNKTFYYGLLNYDFNNKHYAFVGFTHLKDNAVEFLMPNSPDASGFSHLSLGTGWKPFDDIVLKLQYSKAFLADNPYSEAEIDMITAGLSVIF